MPRRTVADTENNILEKLRASPHPLTAHQLVIKCKLTRGSVMKHLLTMKRDGRVAWDGKSKYSLPDS
jgi:DNA-binding IclR family transcriptional regulator